MLLVLAIVMVLVSVGGVTVTAVINTTRLNHSSKIIDDLIYSAESGIELAMGQIRNGHGIFTNSAGNTGSRIDTALHTDTVERVDISSRKVSNTEYEVESIAYSKKNNSVFKKVKSKINENVIINTINPNGDIMKNGLGAGSGNIIVAGGNKSQIDLDDTNINSPNTPDYSGNDSASKLPKPGNANDTAYNKFEIDESKIAHKDKIEVDSFSNLMVQAKDITSGVKAENGIGKIIFQGKMNGGVISQTYTVLIINTKELIVKNLAPEVLYKTAILTNGDITLDGVAVHSTDSTIFGNTLKITNGGSLTIDGSFQYTPTFGAGGGICQDSMNELNNIIKQYITNWGVPSTGGGGTGGSGSSSSDFEFVEGSFEYE